MFFILKSSVSYWNVNFWRCFLPEGVSGCRALRHTPDTHDWTELIRLIAVEAEGLPPPSLWRRSRSLVSVICPSNQPRWQSIIPVSSYLAGPAPRVVAASHTAMRCSSKAHWISIQPVICAHFASQMSLNIWDKWRFYVEKCECYGAKPSLPHSFWSEKPELLQEDGGGNISKGLQGKQCVF